MTLAITNAERYGVLAGYHRDIFSAIEQRQLEQAMRLLFGFAEDYCLNLEADVATLSENFRGTIDAPKEGSADLLLFLQAFHQLWIAMEDHALAGLPPDIADNEVIGVVSDAPRLVDPPGHSGNLTELKKALLLRSSQSRTPLVELNNVEQRFRASQGDFKLGPINLAVPQSQIIGVVGPNGSGKTTLLRLLAGDIAPTAGEVDFAGLISHVATEDARVRGFWPSIKSKIAYVPPNPHVPNDDTELTFWITGAAHGILAPELEHRVKVTMRKYALTQYSGRPASTLSTGYRLRLELARILFTDPALLILDEPIANLDRNAQLTVLEDLRMLSASVDSPRSIVVSSQHIEEISSISDYLIFLSDGAVTFSGRREEVSDALGYSMFEIAVETRSGELAKLLLSIGAIEVDINQLSALALFPKGTDPQRVLGAMFNANFRVAKFRDLSNAIEMLLLLPRFKTLGTGAETTHLRKRNGT